MTRRLLVALLLALGVVHVVAGPAAASCALPTPGALPVGDGVFLGEVVEQRTGFDRFVVEEVWRGPDLAAQVWVQTGTAPPRWPWQSQGRTSVDAELSQGERYVVGLHGDFETTTCTVVDAADVDLATLRPDDARRPSAGGATGSDPGRTWWPLPAAALAVAVVAAVGLSRRGASRRSRHPRQR